jgi:hypothetical protein
MIERQCSFNVQMVDLLVLNVGMDVGKKACFNGCRFGFDKTAFSALRIGQVSWGNVFYVAFLSRCLLNYILKISYTLCCKNLIYWVLFKASSPFRC